MKRGVNATGRASITVQRYWWLWVIVAMTATLALTLWLGLKQSVWFDEAYSISLIKRSYAGLISLTSVDVHPPLYYLLLKGWSELFGMSELALRSFSAICGALAVGFGLLLTKQLFGLKVMAVATPLLVLSPYLLRYAFEIRMYVLASLICVAATYVLVRAIQATNRNMWWWVAYSVLVAAGMYTLYYTAFIWIAHVLWLVYLHFSHKTSTPLYKQPWILAYVGSVILYIPWLPSFIKQFESPALSGISQRVSWEQLIDILSFMFTYQPHWTLTPWGYIGIIALAAFCVYVVFRAFQRAGPLKPYLWLLLLYFAVPILILALGSLPPLRPMFLMRYTSHFLIAGSLLLVASLFIAYRPRMRHVLLATIAITGVLLIGLYNLHQRGNYNFETLSRPQTRQAVQAMGGECPPNSVIMAGSPLIYFELLYYLPNCDIRFYSTHPIGPGGGYATIYQSPKQYYDRDPIQAAEIYLIYSGQRPELPTEFTKKSSQSFKEYRLDLYSK